MDVVLAYLIFAAIAASLLLQLAQQRTGSPVLAIFNRWLRWVVFSLGLAWTANELEWSGRPFWVLACMSAALWFLCETGYNWLMIHALNTSPLPLFPRFNLNSNGDEWPTQARLLRVREWLRREGFRQVQALRAEVGAGIHLRVSVYQDERAETRVQVTFLPQAGGTVTACFTAISQTASGTRYVTDNLFLPFGGFYPEDWLVERSPWRRSLPRLMARHRSRLARAGEVPVPFVREPLVDLNAQQHELDQLNTELGFLLPPPDREEHGKLTSEGRYRVWKEIFLLNYLGRSVRYV